MDNLQQRTEREKNILQLEIDLAKQQLDEALEHIAEKKHALINLIYNPEKYFADIDKELKA
jgi:hypothetical protein